MTMSLNASSAPFIPQIHVQHTKRQTECVPLVDRYVFTREAYQLYLEIPFQSLDSFWAKFIDVKFIDEGDIIYYFMVYNCCEHFDVNFITNVDRYDSYWQKIVKDDGRVNIKDVYNDPTTIVYKGKSFDVPYNLERIEYVWSHYEDNYDSCVYSKLNLPDIVGQLNDYKKSQLYSLINKIKSEN
jgi:hypothetical protein